MSTTLADTAPDTPRSDAAPAAKPPGDILLTLVRREFWEHRALWLAPLVVAGLLALATAFGRVHIDLNDAERLGSSPYALLTIIQLVLALPIYVLALFVGGYYLVDCLYAERKDRSILFWKSLPVSDGLTVCAKLLVGLVVLPFGVFALSLVAQPVYTAILESRVALGRLPGIVNTGFLNWSAREWFRTELVMFLATLFAVLWYAPIAGFLLLVSAWARRAPILWATLPFVLGPLLEWVAFGTRHLLSFVNYRINGIWYLLGVEHINIISKHGIHPAGTALEVLDFRGALTAIDLWLGLAATAALVYAAIRLRRYRDDT
jgi:ABC-2 type transport system permease protein